MIKRLALCIFNEIKEREWRLYKRRKYKRLKNKEFTIIGSNCTGAFMYYDLGLKYLTPTVNLMIEMNDFVKMAGNLEWYMKQELVEGTEEENDEDIAEDEEFLKRLDKGEIDFDVLISTPAYMPKLGKFARLLGPKGLMPNPKAGTVTTDIEKAVKEAKAGKVEYRVDKQAIVHLGLGKTNFDQAKLLENAEVFFESLKSHRPASIKGTYVKSIYITTTMGPAIAVGTFWHMAFQSAVAPKEHTMPANKDHPMKSIGLGPKKPSRSPEAHHKIM